MCATADSNHSARDRSRKKGKMPLKGKIFSFLLFPRRSVGREKLCSVLDHICVRMLDIRLCCSVIIHDQASHINTVFAFGNVNAVLNGAHRLHHLRGEVHIKPSGAHSECVGRLYSLKFCSSSIGLRIICTSSIFEQGSVRRSLSLRARAH